MKSQRCIWTHERGPDAEGADLETLEVEALGPLPWKTKTIEVTVRAAHTDEARAYFERVREGGLRMILWILGLAALQVLAIPLGATGLLSDGAVVLGIGVTLVLMGLVILRYPFCTPETIQMFGVRKSIAIARFLGGVVMALGVGLPAIFGLG